MVWILENQCRAKPVDQRALLGMDEACNQSEQRALAAAARPGHDDCDPTMQCLVIDNRGSCVSRCNQGDQVQFCAGEGQPNCICTMLTLTCDHRTGLCQQ